MSLRKLLSSTALALSLWAAPTPAATRTFYVSPDGATTNGGTGCSDAKTLAWANSNCQAGDTLILCAGTYADPIQPHASGTAVNRITYMGACNDIGAAAVPQIYFGKENSGAVVSWGDYVTVKWVECSGFAGHTNYLKTGALNVWGTALGDSLHKCRIHGQLGTSGSTTVFDSLSVSGDNIELYCEPINAVYSSVLISYTTVSYGNTLAYCDFNITNTTATGDVEFWRMKDAKFWNIHHCIFQFTNAGGSGNNNYVSFVDFRVSSYNKVQFCTFDLLDQGHQTGTSIAWNMRDSTKWNQFFNNSIGVRGGRAQAFHFGNPGTQPNKTVVGNRWEHNHFAILTPLAAGVVFYGVPAARDTFRFNTVWAGGSTSPAFAAGGLDSCLIAHNSFWGGDTCVVYVDSAGTNNSASRFVSNVVISAKPNGGYAAKNGIYSGSTLYLPSEIDADSLGLLYSAGGTAAKSFWAEGSGAGSPGTGGAHGTDATTAGYANPNLCCGQGGSVALMYPGVLNPTYPGYMGTLSLFLMLGWNYEDNSPAVGAGMGAAGFSWSGGYAGHISASVEQSGAVSAAGRTWLRRFVRIFIGR